MAFSITYNLLLFYSRAVIWTVLLPFAPARSLFTRFETNGMSFAFLPPPLANLGVGVDVHLNEFAHRLS